RRARSELRLELRVVAAAHGERRRDREDRYEGNEPRSLEAMHDASPFVEWSVRQGNARATAPRRGGRPQSMKGTPVFRAGRGGDGSRARVARQWVGLSPFLRPN